MKLLFTLFKQNSVALAIELMILSFVLHISLDFILPVTASSSAMKYPLILTSLIIVFFSCYYFALLSISPYRRKSSIYKFIVEAIIVNYVAINFTIQIITLGKAHYHIINYLLHVIAVYSMIDIFRSIAYTILSIEKKRNVELHEYSSTFFLLWFWMFGFWFVHPRVQKILHGIDPVIPQQKIY